jgi:hypothetical protein
MSLHVNQHPISNHQVKSIHFIVDKQLQKLLVKERKLVNFFLSVVLSEFDSSSPFVFLEICDKDNIVTLSKKKEYRENRLELIPTQIATLRSIVSDGFDEKNIDHRFLAGTILELVIFSHYKSRPLFVCRSKEKPSLSVKLA